MTNLRFSFFGVLLYGVFLLALSCNNSLSRHTSKVIIVQPFADFPPQLSQIVYTKLKAINERIVLKAPIKMPKSAFVANRKRYRADTLIRFLGHHLSADSVIIGLTATDISTTNGSIADWGVMGLGFCPGNSCVVSTYRLQKANLQEQFFKVAIHELGHTQGLPHCAEKSCFMRDAEGGNPLNEERDFCITCKTYLRKRNWSLK